MKNIIKQAKSFKIIPEKFKSATIFEIKEYNDKDFTAILTKTNEIDFNDYKEGDAVEIFGLSNDGLIYFVSIIKSVKDNIVTLEYPEKHKNIQRREYPRVEFKGKIEIKEFEGEVTTKDISAGGVKFTVDKPLEIGKTYDVSMFLEENVKFDCSIEIVTLIPSNDKFDIRARFLNIESADRVSLIQYTFRLLMEAESKQG